MTVVPFHLDHDQPLRILGRDDATVLYQSGLSVAIVGIGVDGRPFSTEIPIYRLQLAFGKRAAGQGPQPASSREENGFDLEMKKLAAFADGDLTPCA